MRYYFSGITRPTRAGQLSPEFLLLQAAGVKHILVDQMRLPYIGDRREGVMLDCGSYFAYKNLVSLRLEPYLEIARDRGPFDMMAALDAVMNPQLSHAYWQATKQSEKGTPDGMFPVWQWKGPREYLDEYLSESRIVGVGGLVELMRKKDERMREELIELCAAFPQRLHIFACNWLRCFKDLRDLAFSCDTSKWLSPAKRNTIIFHHTGNDHLAQIPMSEALAAGIITHSLSREERLITSAHTMDAFCNRQ